MSVSLLSQPQMQSALGLGSGGGSGVASLNALVGSVSLTSTDSSISIVADPSANTLNIQSAGGAGGVEGTLYVGTLTTVATANISPGTVAERVISLGALPAPIAVVVGATYRYQLVLEDFTLTNSSYISTASSQCSVMAYVGNTVSQPPASQESLSAYLFTATPFGVLTTDVSPYEVTIVAQPAPPSSQVLSFPPRFVTEGFVLAGETSLYLNICFSGLTGAGFNPNSLSIASGTAIPFQLFLSKVNLL